jgi:hypothetical protein
LYLSCLAAGWPPFELVSNPYRLVHFAIAKYGAQMVADILRRGVEQCGDLCLGQDLGRIVIRHSAKMAHYAFRLHSSSYGGQVGSNAPCALDSIEANA